VEYDDAPPSVDPEVQAALRRKEKMIDAIKDFVMSNPAEAASIIRTWMKQKPAKANQLID
jgi:flagellar biosynthesis/type III secretory pathway M-ring protein FliF/YscJ